MRVALGLRVAGEGRETFLKWNLGIREVVIRLLQRIWDPGNTDTGKGLNLGFTGLGKGRHYCVNVEFACQGFL